MLRHAFATPKGCPVSTTAATGGSEAIQKTQSRFHCEPKKRSVSNVRGKPHSQSALQNVSQSAIKPTRFSKKSVRR